ncbi:hypothetical protein B0J18DRAFT_474238 [Chaetomium sp. MPI-SDFR-AT-0129]|nr:hypothetical protein B0J18DRAFT_474238 [Chaetomium sp. MPI-SDFR-AT-0129]
MKRTLVALATEAEETEQRVYRNQKNFGVCGRYFRFNVDRGLEDVVLDEYEKRGDIVTATEAYLDDPRVHALVTDFLQAKSPSYIFITEADRERYLRLLPYFDPRVAHNLARDLRTDKSTGLWFLEGHFQTWRKDPRSFTWLYAKAGSGKTVLSSTIIDAMKQDHVGALAFFYFSIRNGPVTLRQFKCSLLVQILQQLIRPDKLNLDQVILSMLGLSNNAYIVVDALDECRRPELQRRVIHFLGWLSQQDIGNTRILVTSRREPDLEEAIKALPIHKHLVPFRVGEINRDIRSHLETLLQAETFKRWADSLKEEVLDYLARHSDGVFRWAHLQMQTLGRQEREKDVRKALKRLRKGLEATHEAILKRVQDEDKFEEALAILRWLAYSTQPLTLAEAAEVAAFEVDDTNILPESNDFSVAFHPGNRLMEASSIQRILAGPLVPASFRLDPTNSHVFVFRTCMAYVAHYDDAAAAGWQQPPYPLLQYASFTPTKRLGAAFKLFRHHTKATLTYPALSDRSLDLPPILIVSNPYRILDYAASVGDLGLVKLALDFGASQPAYQGRWTPLHTAALKRRLHGTGGSYVPTHEIDRAGVIGELVNSGHHINSVSSGGWTPLHVAARWAHGDLVDCFLQFNDVDIRAANFDGSTPLVLAAAWGHVEIVSVLLSYENIRPDDVDEEGRTALSWAAFGGHDNIVELLGGHGDVNINAVDFRGRTALIWASSLGLTSVDSDILGRPTWAPRYIVSALCSRHDVSVNPVDNEGRDLHALAQSRHDGVLPTEDTADLEGNRHPNACTTPSDSHNLPLHSFRIDRSPPDKPTAEVENDNRPDFQAFVLGDHRREVCFVKFSHDGSRLVAGGDFHCVVIWDLAFQMALFKLKGHKQAVSCAAWSPDDSMVVTTSLDRTAKLWDADVSRSKPGGLS